MVRNRKSLSKGVVAAMTELERARLGQSWLTALAALDRIDTLPDAQGMYRVGRVVLSVMSDIGSYNSGHPCTCFMVQVVFVFSQSER